MSLPKKWCFDCVYELTQLDVTLTRKKIPSKIKYSLRSGFSIFEWVFDVTAGTFTKAEN